MKQEATSRQDSQQQHTHHDEGKSLSGDRACFGVQTGQPGMTTNVYSNSFTAPVPYRSSLATTSCPSTVMPRTPHPLTPSPRHLLAPLCPMPPTLTATTMPHPAHTAQASQAGVPAPFTRTPQLPSHTLEGCSKHWGHKLTPTALKADNCFKLWPHAQLWFWCWLQVWQTTTTPALTASRTW